MAQDYRLGDEVEIQMFDGSILGNTSIFKGVNSYDVRNNATRRVLRKNKGEVKPENWGNGQWFDLDRTSRIYQIGEQVDMRINRQWVRGTIEHIYYNIQPSDATNSQVIRSYLQVHRRGQPWPQPPTAAAVALPQIVAQAPAQERPASAQQRPVPANIQAMQARLPAPNRSVGNLPEFGGFQIQDRVQVLMDGTWKNGTIIQYDAINFKLIVNIDGVGVRKFYARELRRINEQAPVVSDEESDSSSEYSSESSSESSSDSGSESNRQQMPAPPEATELLNLVSNLPNIKFKFIINKLLNNGHQNDISNYKNNKGENILHILAIDDSYLSLIQHIFNFNIDMDINAEDNNGNTPLVNATCYNSKNISKLLINKGADANNYRYVPPLYYASQFPDNYEIVKLLIDSGADVNASDNDGETPLFAAADRGSIDVVKLLLDSGANARIVNNNGKTAADTASSPEKKQLIENASIIAFPHTTINRNNMPTEARDIINATDENISQFIAENPRNKIFKFMNAYHAINADDFESYFLQGDKKNDNTFYSCKRAMSGLGVGEQDVYLNKPLFSLRNLGFTDYVSMDEIESALQSPNQYFEIIREGALIAPSISSYYSINGRSNANFNLSSRLHCQEGIQSYIYKLAILDTISTGGKKNKTKKQNKYAKRKKSFRKTKIQLRKG